MTEMMLNVCDNLMTLGTATRDGMLVSASFLVNSGRTLYEVQQILRHSDPSVTTRYAHLSLDALREASNTAYLLIEAALKPRKMSGVRLVQSPDAPVC
jgi:hypothetical protein